jgi:hypothetical protein
MFIIMDMAMIAAHDRAPNNGDVADVFEPDCGEIVVASASSIRPKPLTYVKP